MWAQSGSGEKPLEEALGIDGEKEEKKPPF